MKKLNKGGCGCKGDKTSPKLINQETGELNLKGKLLKVPTALLMTIIMVILSPFLVVLVWYIAMRSIFEKDSNIVNLVLGKFKKKDNKIEVNSIDNDDFNEDDYEIVGVDIIK